MHVLVLIGQLPYPLDGGAKIRTFNLLSRLSKRHSMTLVTFSFDEDDSEKVETLKPYFKEIITIPARGQASPLGRVAFALRNLASSMPYSIDKYTSGGIKETVNRLLRKRHFDLIHCDSLHLSENVAHISGTPKVLTEHNVESLIWKRAAENEKNPLKRAYLKVQSERLAKYEAAACKMFDGCIAVSEVDKHTIKALSGIDRCAVVPNGVDCSYFEPQAALPEPFRLVFTGAMDWLPNEDAMVYFAGEVLPLIQKALPEAKLSIVGRSPSNKVSQLAGETAGVEVTGRVEDIRPYIEGAAVYVVPLRMGSGTRLKILEAMAMGRPVVSTQVGCEGLNVTHGKDIMVADEPKVFADSVITLLENSSLAASIGKAGRAMVEREYDWPRLADQLEEVWNQTVKSFSPRESSLQ